ncbi:ATP-dependent sacrificial sulfur transferase LarE [Candidatus Bathyarchaeota archaeon]|nr:MAG: ATP-dependent sacrificial sulfur transferase LarE [Candidatus Bathyarchaeota archaeon]
MVSLDEKYESLKRFIMDKGKEGVIVAFSGGVDSSTLAYVCHEILGDKAVAITAVSPTYPPGEVEDAKRIAKEIGIRHMLIETNELSNENFAKNPENRCYYCKGELLDSLQKVADKLGFRAIFEGTNLSDLSGHRPGFRAVLERENVYSPWVENGFTKDEIRALAKRLGLPIHDKPPLACLASRIPFGERITAERLNRIGKAEEIIKRICGVRQLRVRDHNGLARIEVGKDEMELLFDNRIINQITTELKRLGFKYITLDLEGYRAGSMLLTLNREE